MRSSPLTSRTQLREPLRWLAIGSLILALLMILGLERIILVVMAPRSDYRPNIDLLAADAADYAPWKGGLAIPPVDPRVVELIATDRATATAAANNDLTVTPTPVLVGSVPTTQVGSVPASNLAPTPTVGSIAVAPTSGPTQTPLIRQTEGAIAQVETTPTISASNLTPTPTGTPVRETATTTPEVIAGASTRTPTPTEALPPRFTPTEELPGRQTPTATPTEDLPPRQTPTATRPAEPTATATPRPPVEPSPVPPTQPPPATATATPTAVPPTAVPPTAVPPTAVPPTAVPPTAVPPTAVPPTAVPPTAVPPTAVPPTAVPPTAVPPTAVPPTAVPPTAVPPTAVPPTPTPTPTLTSTPVPPTATFTPTPTSMPTPTFTPMPTPEIVFSKQITPAGTGLSTVATFEIIVENRSLAGSGLDITLNTLSDLRPTSFAIQEFFCDTPSGGNCSPPLAIDPDGSFNWTGPISIPAGATRTIIVFRGSPTVATGSQICNRGVSATWTYNTVAFAINNQVVGGSCFNVP